MRAGLRKTAPVNGRRWIVPDSVKERETWKAPGSMELNPEFQATVNAENLHDQRMKGKNVPDDPSLIVLNKETFMRQKEIIVTATKEVNIPHVDLDPTGNNVGILIMDKKRRRVQDDGLVSEHTSEPMIVEDVFSKNRVTAGLASQARQDQ